MFDTFLSQIQRVQIKLGLTDQTRNWVHGGENVGQLGGELTELQFGSICYCLESVLRALAPGIQSLKLSSTVGFVINPSLRWTDQVTNNLFRQIS